MTAGDRRDLPTADLTTALERPHRLGMIGGSLEDQLAHCASFSSVLRQVCDDHGVEPTRAVDLGTGGGLPGVALAQWWPNTSWTLVDMRSSRATEVERVLMQLGLQPRCQVEAREAQHLGHEPTFREHQDVVVARAFGPPSLTVECAAPLLRVGGVFLLSEPPEQADGSNGELRWDHEGLTVLGLSLPRFLADDGHHFAAFVKEAPSNDKIPRLPPRSNRGWLRS